MATLCRSINKLDISQKHVTKQATEWNEYICAIWEGEMAQYDDPNLFVFSTKVLLTTRQASETTDDPIEVHHVFTGQHS